MLDEFKKKGSHTNIEINTVTVSPDAVVVFADT